MNRKVVVIIAGLLFLGALAALWQELKPPVANFNRAPITGAGQVLVDEIARTLHDHGRIVVVVPAVPGINPPVMPPNGLWDGFQDELKKHSGISVAATEFVPCDRDGMPGIASKAFREVWEHHRKADAIVCFGGLPLWNEGRDLAGPGANPKLIVIDIDTPPKKRRYQDYFSSGMLQLLVGFRTNFSETTPSAPTTPREWFQSRYQVYTVENYESLPD